MSLEMNESRKFGYIRECIPLYPLYSHWQKCGDEAPVLGKSMQPNFPPSLSRISQEPNANGAVARHCDRPRLASAVIAEGLAVRAKKHEAVDVVGAAIELVDDFCTLFLPFVFLSEMSKVRRYP